MTRGYFKPKVDLQLTIRDITPEFIPDVGGVLGRALNEINEMARLSQQVVETAMAQISDGEEPKVQDMKNQLIWKALEKTKGNKTQAAKMLGISVRQIYRWVEKIGETPP